MISVDPSAITRQVTASFPWVASVAVVQRWPHTVAITIVERTPVATVRTRAGALELVDVTGRRLGAPGHGQVLPGLQFAVKRGSLHGVDLVTQLPAAATPGLIVAKTLPPAFSTQVAMITVDARGWVTLHMTTPVTFKLGPASNLGAKYEAVAAIIDHTTLHVGDVVDVSVPQASTVTGP
jgi:cell division protein FtsQ